MPVPTLAARTPESRSCLPSKTGISLLSAVLHFWEPPIGCVLCQLHCPCLIDLDRVRSHALVLLGLDLHRWPRRQGSRVQAAFVAVLRKRREDVKASCKHREKNPRHPKTPFSLILVTPPATIPDQGLTDASPAKGWHMAEEEGRAGGWFPCKSHPSCSILTQVSSWPNSCVPFYHEAQARPM